MKALVYKDYAARIAAATAETSGKTLSPPRLALLGLVSAMPGVPHNKAGLSWPVEGVVASIDSESLTFVVLDLARLFRAEFGRQVEATQLGVTAGEARVLAHMARLGPLRQHLLAEQVGVGQMSLTGFLDRLEAAGLVERSADPDDRRAKQVRLTAAAGPVLAGIAAVGQAVRAAAREGIAEDDWARFRAVALAARDNLAARRAGGAA